jgi:site-specific recombinase XerD
MKRRASPFPRYTHNYKDKNGKLRSDFRRGAVNLPLPYPLLGPEYWETYRKALADYIAGRAPGARSKIGASRTKPGTVAHGFVVYTGSTSFRNGLSDSTQKTHFRILRRWCDTYGEYRLRHLQRRHVAGWVEERAGTPGTARDFLKALRRMMQYFAGIGEIEEDPTQGVRSPKQRNAAIHTWSEAEIEQYRQHHPLGTNARLTLELLVGTAQRRSDVVRMGRQHLHAGGSAIFVKQQKTGWEGEIPIAGELSQALAAVPASNLTFLVTEAGAPFSVAGFGNKFRDWCNEAGLPKECSSHGLRKAACRQLAEAGATPHEIAAISGHISLSEVQRYTKAVDQARLARAARAKTRTQIGEPQDRFSKIAP